MWTRPRTWTLRLAVIGLTTAFLYEYATHVGRGWMCGEAFFEGRLTSYWRVLVELDLRDDPGNLRSKMWGPPPQKFWERGIGWIWNRPLPLSSVALAKDWGEPADAVLIEMATDRGGWRKNWKP